MRPGQLHSGNERLLCRSRSPSAHRRRSARQSGRVELCNVPNGGRDELSSHDRHSNVRVLERKRPDCASLALSRKASPADGRRRAACSSWRSLCRDRGHENVDGAEGDCERHDSAHKAKRSGARGRLGDSAPPSRRRVAHPKSAALRRPIPEAARAQSQRQQAASSVSEHQRNAQSHTHRLLVSRALLQRETRLGREYSNEHAARPKSASARAPGAHLVHSRPNSVHCREEHLPADLAVRE